MKFTTIVMTNPGDFIKDGHLGKAVFSDTKDGPAVEAERKNIADTWELARSECVSRVERYAQRADVELRLGRKLTDVEMQLVQTLVQDQVRFLKAGTPGRTTGHL